MQNPELAFNHLVLEGPEHLSYVYLSVRQSITPAVSGVCGVDEQQQNKFGSTYDYVAFTCAF